MSGDVFRRTFEKKHAWGFAECKVPGMLYETGF